MINILLSLFLACNPQTDSIEKNVVTSPIPPANAVPIGTNANATVATWSGGSLNYSDGTEMAKGQLIQMEAEYLLNTYKAAKQSIEQTILEKVLIEEATKQGFSTQEELLKKEVEDKTLKGNAGEIAIMYEQFKSRLQGMTLEQATPLIEQQLVQQKQGERFQVYLEELKAAYKVEINLPYPNLPRQKISADDDPFLGTDGAPVEIIQFAEFQCPYCGKVGDIMNQLLEEYPGKLKIVYRDFPLGFHDRAIPAAIAANCANDQDKYWEMHTVLMANQRALEETDFISYATNLKLDLDKWNTCRKDPAQEAEVRKDMADASAVGVTGTPAFFVNGIMLSGALPFEEFKEIIDRELVQ
jgi:protein-disulfide isomerase